MDTISSLVTENFLTFQSTQPASHVLGKLQENEKRCALVFHHKKYMGLVDKRQLIHRHTDLANTHIDKFVTSTPILEANTSLQDVGSLFFTSNVTFLPVENEKEIVGVVRALDVALNLQSESRKVKEIKYVKISKISPTDSIGTALDIMFSKNIDIVPVFENGEFSGILEYKEIIRKYLNFSPKRDVSTKFNSETRSARVDVSSFASIPVESFVSSSVFSVQEADDLSSAISKLEERNTSASVVLNGSEYMGLLTLQNVFASFEPSTKNFTIQYVGLSNVRLTEHERLQLDKIMNRECEKLARKIHDPFNVNLHLKSINKDGGQRLFDAHLKIEYHGQVISTNKEDWDLETVLHKCFNMVKV